MLGNDIPPVGLEFEATESVGSSHSSSSSSALELGTLEDLDLELPGKRSDKMPGKPPPPLVVVLEPVSVSEPTLLELCVGLTVFVLEPILFEVGLSVSSTQSSSSVSDALA